MPLRDSPCYEFKFNGCYGWTEHFLGGEVHYYERLISGRRMDIPPQRLTKAEYEALQAQGEMLRA